MGMNARKSEKMRIGVWGSVQVIAMIALALVAANFVSANPVTESSSPQTAPASTPSSSINSCVIWQTLRTAIQSGRVQSRLILPELPDGFKKGCVFYDEGAHTLNFHILKDGVSPDSVSVVAAQPYDSPISQIVPKAFIDDSLMNRGQLLRVGFDSPGETDAAFIRKNAWERAFIRKSEDGRVTVIFRNLFMESKGVPPEVMARLLEATKSQFDKAQKKQPRNLIR
jgi:hypothetical protein